MCAPQMPRPRLSTFSLDPARSGRRQVVSTMADDNAHAVNAKPKVHAQKPRFSMAVLRMGADVEQRTVVFEETTLHELCVSSGRAALAEGEFESRFVLEAPCQIRGSHDVEVVQGKRHGSQQPPCDAHAAGPAVELRHAGRLERGGGEEDP